MEKCSNREKMILRQEATRKDSGHHSQPIRHHRYSLSPTVSTAAFLIPLAQNKNEKQQETPPAASAVDDEISGLSWADVSSLFEQDADFVRRERESLLEEALIGIPEGWREDRTSRAWVASYRLSVFETRRQAQLFFSWAIPDEGCVSCSEGGTHGINTCSRAIPGSQQNYRKRFNPLWTSEENYDGKK